MNLKNLHWTIGTLGLIVFALQGQYMDKFHDHLVGMEDGPRMLFRSGHIYFLLASVLNLALASGLADDLRRHSILRYLTSAVVALAPVLLLIGFFREPWLQEFARPYTRPALYLLFGVGVLWSLAGVYGWLTDARGSGHAPDR